MVAQQTGKRLVPEAQVRESCLPVRQTSSGLLCEQEISSIKSLVFGVLCFRAASDFQSES